MCVPGFCVCVCGSHLMYHQPSRFFWMTSTVTPFSKLTSSFPWLMYGWMVTYFSSADKRGDKERHHHTEGRISTTLTYLKISEYFQTNTNIILSVLSYTTITNSALYWLMSSSPFKSEKIFGGRFSDPCPSATSLSRSASLLSPCRESYRGCSKGRGGTVTKEESKHVQKE